MDTSDILLLLALIFFILAAVVHYSRSKTISWTDIGLAVLTGAMLLIQGAFWTVCVGKPKAPQVEPIPDRRASVLPDGGDPAMRLSNRNRRKLTPAAMIFTNQGTLGAPSIASPSTGG